MKEVRAMIFGLDKQSIEDLFSYVSSAMDLQVTPLLLPTLAMEQRLLQYRNDIAQIVDEIFAVEKSIGMRRYALQRRDVASEPPRQWRDADLLSLAATVNTIISMIAFESLHLENGSSLLEFLTEMTESMETKFNLNECANIASRDASISSTTGCSAFKVESPTQSRNWTASP
jgi:hypothetical protein